MLRVSENTHAEAMKLAKEDNESIDKKVNFWIELEKMAKVERKKRYDLLSEDEKRREDKRKQSRNEFYLQRDLIQTVELYNDEREFVSKRFLFEKFNKRYNDVNEERLIEIIDTIVYPLLEDW